MKIRKGFVSNSSSSSFIVINPKEKNKNSCVTLVKLNENQIKKVKKYIIEQQNKHIKYYSEQEDEIFDEDVQDYIDKIKTMEMIKHTDEVYVTNFISDSLDEYYDFHECGIEYLYGGHGVPYSEDSLVCLNPEEQKYKKVYIHREND